jgi:hypothetical protein
MSCGADLWPVLTGPRETAPTVDGLARLLWDSESEPLVGRPVTRAERLELIRQRASRWTTCDGRHRRVSEPGPKLVGTGSLSERPSVRRQPLPNRNAPTALSSSRCSLAMKMRRNCEADRTFSSSVLALSLERLARSMASSTKRKLIACLRLEELLVMYCVVASLEQVKDRHS